jgi:hypothetical protein
MRSPPSRSNATKTFATRLARSHASYQVMVRDSCAANSPSGVSPAHRSS